MYAQSVISKGQTSLTDDPYYIIAFTESKKQNSVPYVSLDVATIRGHLRLEVGKIVVGLAGNRLSVTVLNSDGNEVITTWFPEEPDFGLHVVTESDTAEEVLCPA